MSQGNLFLMYEQESRRQFSWYTITNRCYTVVCVIHRVIDVELPLNQTATHNRVTHCTAL